MTEDIFAFTSYRAFLQALAERWTAEGKSLQGLAKHCGFSSPNFVQQLVRGKRNLTEAAAEKLARNLALKEGERQYLIALVRLSRAKGANEIEVALTQMKRLVRRAKRRSIADTSIFDNWLHGVVFEMFKLARFTTPEDLTTAETRVGTTTLQLRQSFDFLAKRGYLKLHDGRWRPADVEFQPQNDVRRINGQQNHLKFLVLAQHRMNDELADREFQGMTFAAKESRLPELKERVRAFVQAVNEEFAEDAGADQVMRLQLSLFKILR